MKPLHAIRIFTASLLLLVFAISVTPRSIMHSLFAQHTDEYGFINKDGKAALATSHISCSCETMVVVSPFTLPNLVEPKTARPFFKPTGSVFIETVYTALRPLTGLRGPPVLA